MKHINNIIRAMALVAVMIVTMASAVAQTAVEYIDKDGARQTCEAYTVVEEGTTSWNAGWYLVNSTLEINGGVTVTGAVNLILADGVGLTVTGAAGKAGITVSGDGNSLTIYGQANGTGKIIATGTGHANGTGGGAGIGGDDMCGGGNITINGGDIKANGNGGGAGIGGGTEGTAYNIEVNRGTVVANGSLLGTGIGEGATTWSQKPNTISTVTLAKGGTVVDSLGIGWNTTDTVYVYDGTTLCGKLACRNYDGDMATFTGGITANEGAALSFHRYGSGVEVTAGGPVATVFTGQDGTLAALKSKSDLAATGVTYSADGRYDITLGAPYAVLKLDLSALGTSGGTEVTISAGGETVASVTGVKNTPTAVYVAMPAAQSGKYTFSGNGETVTKTLTLTANTFYTKQGGAAIVIAKYVDLGLPSGTLWATCNVGADSETDYGDYFAWGETTTKSEYSWGTYKWCNGTYNTLTKYNNSSDYGEVDNKTALELSDDAARANWGGDWRMPTSAEFQELNDNCTWVWTTQNGKNGYRVTGKNGNSIFLPAAGFRAGTSLNFAGSCGYYWSSSLLTDYPYSAYGLYFSSGSVYPQSDYDRYLGFTVRPVRTPQQQHEYVDLGLPSGTLWATCNVGADSETDYGDYFAWGETTTKSDYSWETYTLCNGSNNTLTKYNNNSGYGTVDNKTVLEASDDAARANWGGDWRMPTSAEFKELNDNCDWEWTENYNSTGVKGYIVTSKIEGYTDKSIFLPASGNRDGTSLYAGSRGYYWSSSLNSSKPGNAYSLNFSSDYVVSQDYYVRYYGFTVRPVLQHEYVDLGLPSGLKWATCNVGAENPEDYGDYFAWGEIEPYYADGHSQDNPCSTWRTMTTGAGNTDITSGYAWGTYSQGASSSFAEWATPPHTGNVLKSDRDAARANWGGGWRMPTIEEWQELRGNCTWAWITQNGKNGYKVTGKNGNSIFLPAAGFRSGTWLNNAGSYGYYLSSSLYSSSNPRHVYELYFYLGFIDLESSRIRHDGCTVRPVR